MTAEQAKRARMQKALATTGSGSPRNDRDDHDDYEDYDEHDDDMNDDADERDGGGGGRFGRRGSVLSTALGLFSVGLGLAQILAPRGVAKFIGVKPRRKNVSAMRLLGARELSAGIGMLAQPDRAKWAWARVAGDAMDLALLGNALGGRGNKPLRTTAAAVAVLGVTALDVVCAQRLTSTDEAETTMDDAPGQGIRLRKSITINRPAEEVYGFWRNFENLPRFMDHVKEVRTTGATTSHWTAKAPAGTSVEWDAEITEDRPNERIAWQSVEGSGIQNSGIVSFRPAPGNRGTEVHVHMQYAPPAGSIGAFFAKLFGEEPTEQVTTDLRRFKQVMETGEVVHSDASIHSGTHPARPSREKQGDRTDSDPELAASRSSDAADTTNSNRGDIRAEQGSETGAAAYDRSNQ